MVLSQSLGYLWNGLNANFYRIDDDFNELFTSYAGCNIQDCFNSHHSCSEARKDG